MEQPKRLFRRMSALVVSFVVGLVLFPTTGAHACSCAGFQDLRDWLQEADGAIVGTFVSQRPEDPADPYGESIYTFEVDDEVKGDFGDTLEVHSASNGAACGLSVEQGRQEGLFLYRYDGTWSSNSCSQVPPDRLREAATPLPEPTGQPPSAFLFGGSFEDARTMGLDADGRITGYGYAGRGFGEAETSLVARCPKGRRVVEIVSGHPGRDRFAVRRLRDMKVVREMSLAVRRHQDVGAVSCRNARGTKASIFTTAYGRPHRSRILEVAGNEMEIVHRGDARAAAFHGRFAYLLSGKNGRRLVRVDLSSLTTRRIARLPARVWQVAVSDDGRNVAGISFGGWDHDSPPSRAVMVRLGTGKVVTRSLHRQEVYAEMEWVNDARVGLFSEGGVPSRIFDLSLDIRRRLPNWVAYDSTVSGRWVYGLQHDYGCYCALFVRARLDSDGAPRTMTELPSPQVYTVEALR